jgi:hypothetical protein
LAQRDAQRSAGKAGCQISLHRCINSPSWKQRLAILKHMRNLSEEAVCALWVENPYQYFCGDEFFQHELSFDGALMMSWRNRMRRDPTRIIADTNGMR